MPLTFQELKEKLKREPEINLLEVLEIDSTDLVDRFEDKIELKYNQLIYEFEDEFLSTEEN